MNEPTEIQLRPANEADASTIRLMVRGARINPFGLDWRRFVLAESKLGQVVGCAQIKPHADGSDELASLVVAPAWRGRGVARQLIEHLLAVHPGTLYLTCRADLGILYAKFGFRALNKTEMPPYFKRISRLFQLIKALGIVREDLLVMMRNSAQLSVKSER